ncbi:MAG: bifunctional phosphoglucose/phosphomannose isomerase [Rhodothermales bacterium]|nr:bifunctional phosphoglucose/phosphomannose isomerase [Rhodothermales bacterium]
MQSQTNLTLSDIRRIDTQGMYDLVAGFPDHFKQGRAIAEAVSLSIDARTMRQLVVIGMGGSAISGDLLRCYAVDQSRIPIQVVRHYALPASVDDRTLVVASSFSGNTEESLSGFEEAIARKATIVCIASGGQLLDLARKHGLPYAQIPGGMSPRAAIGYSLAVLMVFARKMGLIQVADGAWDEADALLRAQTARYSDPASTHLARTIADGVVGRIPLVYSSNGLLEAVNLRWRGQFQENSKMMAAGNLYPELNHNEIMGWEQTGAPSLQKHMGVIVLRDREDHPRIQHRMNVTRSLIDTRAGSWAEVQSEGDHRLTRMVSLINLGDWASLYAAYLRGVDPTPIGLIDQLKDALAKV